MVGVCHSTQFSDTVRMSSDLCVLVSFPVLTFSGVNEALQFSQTMLPCCSRRAQVPQCCCALKISIPREMLDLRQHLPLINRIFISCCEHVGMTCAIPVVKQYPLARLSRRHRCCYHSRSRFSSCAMGFIFHFVMKSPSQPLFPISLPHNHSLLRILHYVQIPQQF